MQTKLTLDQLRDLFYMENRLDIVLTITDAGSVHVPSRFGGGTYFDNLDEAYSYIKGYFDAAVNNAKLDAP